uniref:Gypsy retrotransposon integrase-like protein 1 n=1 Tax=Knipowitschia caucasica TaxID=637954 RepID=A0AAV2M0R0_KNICA
MEREIEELERAVLENCRLLEEVEGAKPKRFQERHAADGYSTARPQRPLEAGWTPPHYASEDQSTERPQLPLEAEDQQDLRALMIGLERRFGKRLHAEESREQLSGLYRKEGENLGLTPERLRQYVRLARPRCLNEALQEAERAEIVLSTRPNLGRATNMLQRVRQVDYEEVGVEEVYQLETALHHPQKLGSHSQRETIGGWSREEDPTPLSRSYSQKYSLSTLTLGPLTVDLQPEKRTRKRQRTRKVSPRGVVPAVAVQIQAVPAAAVQVVPAATVQAIPVAAVQVVPAAAVQAVPEAAVQAVPAGAVQAVPAAAVQVVQAVEVQAVPAAAVQVVPAVTVQAVPEAAVQAVPAAAVRVVQAVEVQAVEAQAVLAAAVQAVPVATVQAVPEAAVQAVPAAAVQVAQAVEVQAVPAAAVQAVPAAAVQVAQAVEVQAVPAAAVQAVPAAAVQVVPAVTVQAVQVQAVPAAVVEVQAVDVQAVPEPAVPAAVVPDVAVPAVAVPAVVPAAVQAADHRSPTPAGACTASPRAIPPPSTETVNAVKELWQRSSEGLDQCQKEQLRHLLDRYVDIFAARDEDCTQTRLVQHSIDTGSAPPIRLRPHRLALSKRQLAEDMIHKMLAAGIIEPSSSPWAAPVVIVRKRLGGWRFCVDYRRLNAVELSPQARAKTAFTFGQGLWQFRVMPFGLCNAPATFERLMERVLADIPRSHCVVYLDDLLVHASDFSKALGHLSGVSSATVAKSSPHSRVHHVDLPYVMDTDASGTGIGAVLSQQGGEGERVVGYYSRALSREERNYCVTRRELLAVVMAVHHFRPYLHGNKFLLRTDHASLTWLLSFKQPEGQVARWLEVLQTYDFDIQHHPGQQHNNADALSRRPCVIAECRYCERQEERDRDKPRVSTATINPPDDLSSEQLQQQQESDTTLALIRKWLELPRRPEWPAVSPHGTDIKAYYSQWGNIELRNGLLFRRWRAPGQGKDILQLLVPRSLQPQVLQSVHGSIGSGHFGISKTLHRLRGRFYWPGCRQDVEIHVHCCDLCTARKGPTQRSHAPLQQYLVGAPMERVVQESSQCTPAALMFGRELRTPVDLVFGSPPEPEIAGGHEMDYFQRLREHLRVVHDYTRQVQASSGVRQKRAYDSHCRGQPFQPGDKVFEKLCEQTLLALMALPFHAPADLPLPPGAWDALQVLLADDQEDAEAGMDDDADWEDWEDWDASPLDVFWDENSDWDDALVPDDEEYDQDTKSEEEDQDTEGEEDNQTVPEWSPSSPSPDLVPSRPPVSFQDFVPLTRARRHRDEEEDEEDNQTVPEWSTSSPSPDLVPSRRPVSFQDFEPLTRARRHRDEEEEEEPISKRPRFSYDEDIFEEPTLSDSAGTLEGFTRYFLQPHLPQDSDSEQD